jgi:DNA repair photolyase
MALNKSKGNMYEFVTHTWNTVKGACPHDCGYCYMKGMAKRFNKPQSPVRFDESELKTNLGSFNTIFVGSSNDLFAESIPDIWIVKTLNRCQKYSENEYMFQTKNPQRILDFTEYDIIQNSVVCTTLESDIFYPDYMGNTPHPIERSIAMQDLNRLNINTFVTIEPIMQFHLDHFVRTIKQCNPQQVNIGADTGNNHLPEPSKEKILSLIAELEKFTKVKQKRNLQRLLK